LKLDANNQPATLPDDSKPSRKCLAGLENAPSPSTHPSNAKIKNPAQEPGRAQFLSFYFTIADLCGHCQ
jgi:hypothetical protein